MSPSIGSVKFVSLHNVQCRYKTSPSPIFLERIGTAQPPRLVHISNHDVLTETNPNAEWLRADGLVSAIPVSETYHATRSAPVELRIQKGVREQDVAFEHQATNTLCEFLKARIQALDLQIDVQTIPHLISSYMTKAQNVPIRGSLNYGSATALLPSPIVSPTPAVAAPIVPSPTTPSPTAIIPRRTITIRIAALIPSAPSTTLVIIPSSSVSSAAVSVSVGAAVPVSSGVARGRAARLLLAHPRGPLLLLLPLGCKARWAGLETARCNEARGRDPAWWWWRDAVCWCWGPGVCAWDEWGGEAGRAGRLLVAPVSCVVVVVAVVAVVAAAVVVVSATIAVVVVSAAVAVVVVATTAAASAIVEAAASSVSAAAAAVLVALCGCDVAFGESGLGQFDALEQDGFVRVSRGERGHLVVNPAKR